MEDLGRENAPGLTEGPAPAEGPAPLDGRRHEKIIPFWVVASRIICLGAIVGLAIVGVAVVVSLVRGRDVVSGALSGWRIALDVGLLAFVIGLVGSVLRRLLRRDALTYVGTEALELNRDARGSGSWPFLIFVGIGIMVVAAIIWLALTSCPLLERVSWLGVTRL